MSSRGNLELRRHLQEAERVVRLHRRSVEPSRDAGAQLRRVVLRRVDRLRRRADHTVHIVIRRPEREEGALGVRSCTSQKHG